MTDLNRLARPSGGLAMVAMDQRESLRTMFAEATGTPATDEELTRFKLAVAGELGPLASGFLIDHTYGYDAVVERKLLPAGCGLILAADALVHPPGGGPVVDTLLDDAIDPAEAAARGAVALKLLVLWRADNRDRVLAMAETFVRRCAAAGLLSVLEGVVPPGQDGQQAGAEFDEEVVTAATALGGLRPSLYKCQMPRLGVGEPAELAAVCARITSAVPVPWVVLSQGVSIADFPAAVRVACGSGASGFLAGRAIWRDTLTDPARLLRERSVERLTRLAEIVDNTARSWQEALAG
jgi:sulfofructosephosphate aldolase